MPRATKTVVQTPAVSRFKSSQPKGYEKGQGGGGGCLKRSCVHPFYPPLINENCVYSFEPYLSKSQTKRIRNYHETKELRTNWTKKDECME